MKQSKKIALSAVFSAMGVVILLIGSATNVLDISCAGIASLLVLLANIEIGGAYPFMIFTVTSVLSALLLPDKFGALVYICIIGWYPLVKRPIEMKLRKVGGWLCKLAVFNLSLTLIFFIARYILGENELNTMWLMLGFAALSNIVFILFDVALTRLITVYYFRYRHKLGKIFR